MTYVYYESETAWLCRRSHPLCCRKKTLGQLIEVLSKESGIAIEWLSNNHMIAIILTNSQESTETTIRIKDKIIKTEKLNY